MDDGVPDFEAEGLLADLSGGARAARLRLLRRLLEGGIGLEALRDAVAQDRLVILPAEHELSGEPRYTTRELSERAGVPVDYFEAVRRAAGLAPGGPGKRNYDDPDL